LDPTAVFGDPEYDAGGVFDRVDNFVAVRESVGHVIDLYFEGRVSASRISFPDEVRGSESRTTIFCGTLKFARLSRRKVNSSRSTTFAPGRGTKAAPITWPRFGSGMAKTIVSCTPGEDK